MKAEFAILAVCCREFGPENIRVNAGPPGRLQPSRSRNSRTHRSLATIFERQALKREIEPAVVARLAPILAAGDSSSMTHRGYVVERLSPGESIAQDFWRYRIEEQRCLMRISGAWISVGIHDAQS